MAISYTTRRGKTYYLHTGPKRGGGTQHYVSTDPEGSLAASVPEGFEIYETPNGQVYLRRKKPALIHPDELAFVEKELQNRGSNKHCYLAEISGEKIVIHEGDTHIETLLETNSRFSARGLVEYAMRNAHYTPMRFVLQDKGQRVFALERYCFRGSVEDWISISEPDQLERLASEYLKHLGKETLFDLY